MSTRRISTAILTGLLTLAFTFIGGGSAQATHTGPFLYHAGPSSLTPCVNTQVKTHTGTVLDVVCYGEWSQRGVMRAWVSFNYAAGHGYRLRIQSIATGAIYTSGCNASMQIGNGDGTGNSAKVIGVYAC